MTSAATPKFGMGAPLRRIEDDSLITGQGRFTDDHTADGVLHAYVLRSPYAHATFTIRSTEDALNAHGVHMVLIHKDIAFMKAIRCAAMFPQPDGSAITPRDLPILCENTVRHVGDAIAFIVAESLEAARDASELIDIDFEMLDSVSDTALALDENSAVVYEDAGHNLAFRDFLGNREGTDEAFKQAASVSEIKVINNRLICNYMEPRSCLSYYDTEAGRHEVILGSQGVHGIQGPLCQILGLEKEDIRVITRDVGGGFGTKGFIYREYPLVMHAAKKLGRPVKWTSDRAEHFLADAHGRDNIATAQMAMDKDGKFLAMKVHLVAAMGAYLHFFAPYIPKLGISMTTGLYNIAHMAVDVEGVYTHTVPTDAYRGAGRPEAAYLVERLVQQCAYDLDLPVDEIRRRNFIAPEQLPYTTQGGRMYDTGEFNAHMDLCMERAGWSDFDARAKKSKTEGKLRGIGMATYIEACAFAGSEPAYVSLNKDGTVDLKIGTQSNGQGHATAYAQIAAEKLGIDYSKVIVHQGDTDELSKGGGTGGSRSVPLGGVSSARAGENLAEKIKDLAADKLEASSGDIELVNGEARIVGTDRAISFADIASSTDDEEKLKADGNFKQEEATYPNGTHICEVEIDPQTGATDILGYTIVDDFGKTVNPLLLAGQIHGGVVQGIGQCINEHVVYDEDGQLLSATLMDYSLPRAAEIPNFHFETRNVPSTTNALGMKGAGEAGTIGACPAVMNAVVDALHRHNGTNHVDMPVTPSRMWALLNAS